MTSERWRRIEELFEGAAALPRAERRAFLAARAADDEDLVRAVEELLLAETEAAGFLERPALEGGLPNGEERRIGAYRLLRKIGEGGMSTVFLARRDDEQFRRQVVLKVVRRGMESVETARRLRIERQILAGLDHPNIARLFDGGMTEDGLPYFVMEHIDGLAIDEYCQLQRLSVDERLLLFRKVCSAVHYAHQKLIVHRDLKPSNILVGADGEPKLLDFGIAKLLDPEIAGGDFEATAAWMRWMTPHFASPEQIRGSMVTTASDVYSLGVLLYRLLTGRYPYDLDGRSLREVEKIVTDGRITKPSTSVRTTPGAEMPPVERLDRRLSGDLDTIVLKALQPAPQRRYGSAADFADDLRRHQEGYPVRARPDTLGYRAAKFLRRHWVPAASVAAVVLTLAGSTVGLIFQSLRVTRERDQARAAIAFVKQAFQVAGEGEELTVRQAVDRSLAAMDRGLSDQPEIRATLLDTTGTIYLNLGALQQARGQLEKAVEARRSLYGDASPEVAESRGTLAVALARLGEFEAGREAARLASEQVLADLGEAHPLRVKTLNDFVTVLCWEGDYATAEPLSLQALEEARRQAPEQAEVARALSNRAFLENRGGDFAAATDLYREALERRRQAVGDLHPEVAELLNNLALALKQQDRLAEAEEMYRQTLSTQGRLYGEDNPNVALTENNLATLLRRRGLLEEAEASYRSSLGKVERSLGKSHYGALVVSTGLALTLTEAGRPEEAETLLLAGLPSWRERLDGSWMIAYAEGALGWSLAAQGRLERAEALLGTSYRAIAEAQGPDNQRTRDAYDRLRRFYERVGRPAEVERWKPED
ncbi:MAG: tetratricopeptide repeat protein [Acidobacteriota bacterium]